MLFNLIYNSLADGVFFFNTWDYPTLEGIAYQIGLVVNFLKESKSINSESVAPHIKVSAFR